MRYFVTEGDSSTEVDLDDSRAASDGIFFTTSGDTKTEVEVLAPGAPGQPTVLRVGNRVVRVELQGSLDAARCSAWINGRLVGATIENELQRRSRPQARASGPSRLAVKAPMPGRVVRVAVTVGDHVQAGDALLDMEAMKMENQLCSTGAGIVSKVLVAPGDTVEAAQPLIVLDPA